MAYQFKPSWGMTIATILVAALCVKLGSWQYIKAQTKLGLQEQLDNGIASKAVRLPKKIDDEDRWRYKRVAFSGTYQPEYQLLLDNQVNDSVVGYHVLTPVKVTGEPELYVLVNRGWIKGHLNRAVPQVVTPAGDQQFSGDIVIPLAKFFTLESPQDIEKWREVWQHIDMARYQKLVPFDVLPYVVRLNAESDSGGFSRNWPLPADRVTVHLGYAYQWFGFALTLLVIYIVLNLKKAKKES